MEQVSFLNATDYSILFIAGFSVVISLFRGFVREAISLASWILAFWIAFHFTEPLGALLSTYIQQATLRVGLAFFTLLIVSLIIGSMVNFLFGQLVLKTGLSGTDRMVGVVFGFGRGVLIIAILLLMVSLTTFPQSKWWKTSLLIPYFKPIVVWLQQFIPNNINFPLT